MSYQDCDRRLDNAYQQTHDRVDVSATRKFQSGSRAFLQQECPSRVEDWSTKIGHEAVWQGTVGQALICIDVSRLLTSRQSVP